MVVDERVRKALDLKRLKLPASVPIVRLWAEDYTDWEGEDALMVHAIVPEELDVDQVKGRDVSMTTTAIRESLRSQGITAFPYIKMYKASEVEEVSGESEE
jgi:hypothetical protein